MNYASFSGYSLVFSDSNRVYRYYTTGNILIHDYNLAVGDSFYFKNSGKSKLLSIDSQLVNAAYLKRFNFQNGVKWVKGIGDVVFGAQWNANAYGFFGPGPFGLTFGSAFMCWSEKKKALLGTGCDMTVCNGIPPLNTVSSTSILCSQQSATLATSGAMSYTWSTGSNQTYVIITPSVTTVYTVNATTSNNCSLKSVITQSVDACIGIEEYKREKIRIYPNPANQFIYLKSEEVANNSEMEIINSLGEIVLKTNYSNAIDVSKLASGVYTLKIFTKESRNYYSKFVKE